MEDVARQKAEQRGGTRAAGGELIDSPAQFVEAEMPSDVGISGDMPKAGVEQPANIQQLEKNQSFHVALSRLEGSLVQINDLLQKGFISKNILGGELSRFNEQMKIVEDMMHDAHATKPEIVARLGSHETQYRKWYTQWAQMK
ncbi:MAG: hypothetical protein HY981_04105 [Candidatus Magasanikbacteria bacterium]|nr:hypothetical protein [Candidatus Magasanikbacteria bacterium]